MDDVKLVINYCSCILQDCSIHATRSRARPQKLVFHSASNRRSSTASRKEASVGRADIGDTSDMLVISTEWRLRQAGASRFLVYVHMVQACNGVICHTAALWSDVDSNLTRVWRHCDTISTLECRCWCAQTLGILIKAAFSSIRIVHYSKNTVSKGSPLPIKAKRILCLLAEGWV